MTLTEVGILFVIVLVCVYLWFEYKQYRATEYYKETNNGFLKVKRDKGLAGEFTTWEELKGIPGYKKTVINCYVPKRNGDTTEIDFILLHETGIYLFESKNYGGWIYGYENRRYWLQTLPLGKRGVQKNRIFNPVIQNKIHKRWLARYVGKDPSFFYTYVVFGDRCTLKRVVVNNDRHKVVYMSNLLSEVKKQIALSETKLTAAEIDALYEKLKPLTKVDEEQKRRHVENIKENLAPVKMSYVRANYKRLRCPSCNGRLVVRHVRRGRNAGTKFLGCSNYPNCKFTKSVINDL